MTVCVATRCHENIVFGASDRMLTSGDVEFEPDTAKIIPLTTSIVAMTAGDSAFQAEIIWQLFSTLKIRLEKEPKKWLSVRDVAYLYQYCRTEIKKKRAEVSLLVPLGLDQNSFISRQKEMAPDFISKLIKELVNFNVPSIETILAGVDDQGSHIYTILDDDIRCDDAVGFSAIGSGYWHANSQLMLARYHYEAPMADSLLLTYMAKKRAEVAPGVGKGTDMFTVGPQLGSYTRIVLPETWEQLKKTSEAIQKKERGGPSCLDSMFHFLSGASR